MEGFDYIVVRPEKPKVCFGSGIERECLPAKGPALSSFMLKFTPELRRYPGPCDFHTEKGLIKKLAPKTGYTALASKTPRSHLAHRSQKVPPVGTYTLDPCKDPKQAPKPFWIGSKMTKKVNFLTPAPGSYTILKRHTKTLHGFGKERKIFPAVRVICTPQNLAHCHKCCVRPCGDYWHNFASGQDMCRPCMTKEYDKIRKCGPKAFIAYKRMNQLQEYVRVRYCGFYHDHNGTTAAVQHLPWPVVKFKILKENYLASFGY